VLYDLGLILSIGIGSWLALDVSLAESWRRRSLSLGLMGVTGALWASCEVLIAGAETAAELALLRRLLYLAVAGATYAWYRVAVEADAPRWFRSQPRWALLALAPLAFGWSALWWAPDGTIIGLYDSEPVHGPYWMAWAALNWTLTATAIFYFGRATLRLRGRDQHRAHALMLAVCLPVTANVAYAAGWVPVDPAPCLLGPVALLVRFGVIDVGLARYLPLARSDILEQLEPGVVVADLRGRVLDANASAARLLQMSDVRGRQLDGLRDRLPPGIEVTCFPLESHYSQTAIAAVLTDRREAVEAEQRLQLAGRLEALGSLTAGIAHEVNNPLAYISSNLNTVEKLVAELRQPANQAQLPPGVRTLVDDGAEGLSDAREGFERISMLVARLKGFARKPRTDAPGDGDTFVDLGRACRKAASMAGIGVQEGAVAVNVADGETVPGSDEVVTQILVNLILNAIQASEGTPQVEVDLRRMPDEVAITVSDRGRGIDAANLDQVFDPFFTTKRSGSGLGLSLSFDLAQRLGGRIEAENRPGGGAVFSLFLPTRSHDERLAAKSRAPGARSGAATGSETGTAPGAAAGGGTDATG
jgi:signal transduction histidine kinase